MCLICQGADLTGIIKLDCSDCKTITEIPNIVGPRGEKCLKYLNCSNCTNITKISNIAGLKFLSCAGCINLIEIPNIVGLIQIYCVSCTNLTKIPNIEGLKDIVCFGCTNLREIPNIVGLKYLNCANCINLIEIPNIRGPDGRFGLNNFDCSGCTSLLLFDCEFYNGRYSFGFYKICPIVTIVKRNQQALKEKMEHARLRTLVIRDELESVTWRTTERAMSWCWEEDYKREVLDMFEESEEKKEMEIKMFGKSLELRKQDLPSLKCLN